MRLGHPSPGRATCGLVVLVFRAVSLRREGSIRVRHDQALLPGRAQRLVYWNKEQEPRSQTQEKRGTGCCGQNKCLKPGRCVTRAHRPSSILAGAQSHTVPWCESHAHSEGGAGGLFLFLPCPPAFKGFTVTVLPLFPRCGTYDCSKLAVGSVLTSPNAHIMEHQRSVNDWIRGTAASSTNFFF